MQICKRWTAIQEQPWNPFILDWEYGEDKYFHGLIWHNHSSGIPDDEIRKSIFYTECEALIVHPKIYSIK